MNIDYGYGVLIVWAYTMIAIGLIGIVYGLFELWERASLNRKKWWQR